jgi:hypothetical protein
MAGAGVRKGLSYDASDELGFDVAEDPVHSRTPDDDLELAGA